MTGARRAGRDLGVAAPGSRRTRSPRSARTRPMRSWRGSSSRCADVHEPLAALYGRTTEVDALFERARADRARRGRRAARTSCVASTAAGRSTPAGSSGPVDAGLRLLRRPLLRHARRAARAGWTTSPSSAPPTCTSCRCCEPRPGENDGGYAVMDYRAVDPRLGTMADLEDGGRRAARARHEPVHRPGAQPHRPRAPRGRRAGWPATPPTPASTRRSPTGDARRLRRDDPRGVPRPRARLVQLGARGLRRRRRLGLDDVLALPVGPRLHQPRGARWRCSARSPGWPTAASTSSAWTPSRSCGSGWAPAARTSRRGTCCCSCCTR